MKFLWKHIRKYRWMILFGMLLKLAGTLTELLLREVEGVTVVDEPRPPLM